MKVRVVGPYQVMHEDKQHLEGDEFDVNDGDAQPWLNAGYVEQVRERKSSEKSDEKAQADSKNKAQPTASNKAAGSADSK